MKELAIHLLLTLGGKAAGDAEIKSAAEAVGITVDAEAVTALHAAIEGKNLDEIIEAGRKKLVNVGGGGGGGAAAPAAAAGGAAPAAAAKEEKKKEEEPEEEVGGAGGLFGDDDDL